MILEIIFHLKRIKPFHDLGDFVVGVVVISIIVVVQLILHGNFCLFLSRTVEKFENKFYGFFSIVFSLL